MRFIDIPDNGSSWRGRLPYRFDTESVEAEDVMVEILNASTGGLLGAMRLYGVTEAEVDIASYIRPHLSLAPVETTRQIELVTSPSAVTVVVRVNGFDSPQRTFFRSQFDPTAVGTLSNHATTQEIVLGEAVRLTLYALSEVSVVATVKGVKAHTLRSTNVTNGCPMELVIPTSKLGDAEGIMINMRLDGKVSVQYNYVVVPRPSGARRMVWYNTLGGIESYLFDHSKRLGYSVKRSDVYLGVEGAKGVEGNMRYRLCSGYEMQMEMERVAQLLLSPVAFIEDGGLCRRVEVESHDVVFDSKGKLHTIMLDINEKWEGGGVVW
jgi:hypothetical protein